MQLDRFEMGLEYEVGPMIGSLMLAERWAVPADIVAAPPTPEGAAEVVARDVASSIKPPAPAASVPANLIRELYPPYLGTLPSAIAADFDRRKPED